MSIPAKPKIPKTNHSANAVNSAKKYHDGILDSQHLETPLVLRKPIIGMFSVILSVRPQTQ